MNKAVLLLIPLLVSGCAQDVSPNSYSVGSVGEVNRTIAGIVISARAVNIKGTTALGGSTGALAGAAAGSALGGGVRSNIVGAVGGAVVGGIAGAVVENSATKQMGMEYVIQTTNGNMMTIVQGISPTFTVGTKVLVLYGSPSRVIQDPRV
ncbi:glycine zipper domain-containing protein [uncultured Pantoea sp.]|jgi:outer membrane lipoprotein SlyB|uniref:glycine zipper domain-containing protein n=1 Tax=uncultured Pantoea sp. TaxID=218084 RepID=UPI0025F53C42|nr:glycine zipper domain-containing protein [uncultured Pantoea sp.]